MTENVNLTCNSTSHACYFCFHNVTNSFLFLEYCEVRPSRTVCASDFCCNKWDTFVSRTCVNLIGDEGKL